MKPDASSRGTTTTRVARIPYLNSAPFFHGLSLAERYELIDCAPRHLGEQAAAGKIASGLLPVVDYFRLEERFERLGHFGIAVRGRARSVLLFAKKPIRQLDGSTIVVSEETSTSACLLRLLLEQRYHVIPSAYQRGKIHGDALLLIGDEAIRFQHQNAQFPYEIDLAFEWWLWQHLPFVFAVWAARKDASTQDKRHLEAGLAKALSVNAARLGAIAQDYSGRFGIPALELEAYLSSFIYRLGRFEEEGILRFKELVNEHHLL
jgi:chorismate dehydratase